MNILEYVQNFVVISVQIMSCLLIGVSLLGLCIAITSRYRIFHLSIMGIIVGACGFYSEKIMSLPYNLDVVIVLVLLILCALSVDLDRKASDN
ncbi:hypothetical protein C3733_20005 [Bacillus amyloliquefaciens]|nr:hypothetical protein C3733_20005 [Bacillus amyloliquefaciens]